MRPMVRASSRSTDSAQVLGQSCGHTEWTRSGALARLALGSNPVSGIAFAGARRREIPPDFIARYARFRLGFTGRSGLTRRSFPGCRLSRVDALVREFR